MIPSELQYFAFCNPLRAVTGAKRKNRPTCKMDKTPHYYPDYRDKRTLAEPNSSPGDSLPMDFKSDLGLEMGLLWGAAVGGSLPWRGAG